MIDRKKTEFDSKRPLTEGEAERLTEEFVVEYTYNSNAIEGNTLTLRETDLVLRGLTLHVSREYYKRTRAMAYQL